MKRVHIVVLRVELCKKISETQMTGVLFLLILSEIAQIDTSLGDFKLAMEVFNHAL